MKSQLSIKKTLISFGLIILIIILVVFVQYYFEKTQEKPVKIKAEEYKPSVEVSPVALQDFEITVESDGVVEAAKKVQMTSEVRGRLVEVSESLKVGNIFRKGELIAQVDRVDYESAFAERKAAIADAKLLIEQETARAETNIKEWKRLGKGEPSSLVARKPQLERAKANLLAAEAALQRAERELKRTSIIAPFNMVIQQFQIEKGAYLNIGSPILSARSETELEVRIQLPMQNYLLLGGENKQAKLIADIGNQQYSWNIEFSRDEGRVEQSTLSIPVFFKILPNEKNIQFKLPPTGLYVKAKLPATTLKQKIVIPRSALKLGNKVLISDMYNKLNIKDVEVIYTNKNYAVVEGVEEGENVILSPLETPVNGMQLNVEIIE